MLHNPVDYPQPEQFNPERFLLDGRLNPKVKDPLLAAFGFGRRCVIPAGRASQLLTRVIEEFARGGIWP